MTITATIVITGDDAKFAGVMAALGGGALGLDGAPAGAGTPSSGTIAPSGGTTTQAPAFTPSINGTFVLGPPHIDGAICGNIVDANGTTFGLQWVQAALFPGIVVDGIIGYAADQCVIIDPTVGPTDRVTANAVVYLNDLTWNAAFRGGNWVTVPAIPPNPNPNPPVMGLLSVPPTPPGSVVTGPAPVTATATGMAAAITAAAAGATVALSAGVYTETAGIAQPIHLSGAGETKTTINCQGVVPFFQKAVLVPEVAGSTIANMSITGAAIGNGDGGNAAGVRDNGDGVGFTLASVEIFGCQMGVLTFASPIAMDGCHIHDNGNATAPAGTHNVYVGQGPSFALSNSLVEHCTHEHEIKSRSKATTITGCTITTGGKGSCIDCPDGGLLTVSNTTLALGKAASDQDEVVIHYGEESAANLSSGQAIVLSNVVIDTTALPGVSALFVLGSFFPDATLTLNNVTYKGDTAPSFQGFAPGAVAGTIAKAAA